MQKLFNVPWPKNEGFVGREGALAGLRAALRRGEIAAIVGAGGLGKTQVAVELAYRVRAAYPGGVWWVGMEQPEGITAQVAALAGPDGLDLPGYDPNRAEHNRDLVRAAWEQPDARLLIFDNLEDPALLRAWKPREGGCRILLTSRHQAWSRASGVWPVPLGPLERDASLVLLLSGREWAGGPSVGATIADADEGAAARTICDEVGDLPLALALAGSYLEAYPHTTLVRYLAQIREQGLAHAAFQADALGEELPTGHEQSILATFALSYDRLLAADPADARALMLFHRAGQLAPAPIPRPLLVRLAADDTGAEPTDEAGDAADAALRRLTALGLIELLPTDDTARLHRLLAAYARLHAPEPAADVAAVENALAWELSIINEKGYPLAGLPYLDHARAAAAWAEVRGDADAAPLLNNLARLLQVQGDYAAARPLYERALAIREQALGPTHPATALSFNNLAALLREQGDYGAARPLYERALAIDEAAYGPDHPEVATDLNNLALLLYTQGDYGAARPLYERALAINEQALGPTHPETATNLNNLANLLHNQGDYAVARPLYERALVIREQALGPTHPDTAASLDNLALLFKDKGDYAAAQPLYERAQLIWEQVVGPNHPDTAVNLNNLAQLLQDQGDYGAARPLYKRALAIREAALGPTHPDTAISIASLGVLHYDEGDYAAACPLMERAVWIVEQALGPEHPTTRQLQANLAACLARLGAELSTD